jgi:hypothetical protein
MGVKYKPKEVIMKRKNYCYIVLLLLAVFIFDCSPPGGGPPGNPDPACAWFKRLGGTGKDEAMDIIKDHAGNIIITGYVTGDADLNGDGDTDDGGETAAACHGEEDIFIVKFSPEGTYLWSERLGGLNDDNGEGVAVDSSDNIFVTGWIAGDADLNGNGNVGNDWPEKQDDSYGGGDIFVTKFSSGGVYQWSIRVGGTGYDVAYSIMMDTNDNMILAGSVWGDVDLNWDADSSDSGESGAGFGSSDIIVVKYDAAVDMQWAVRLGGSNGDQAENLVIDESDNILITGGVAGDADLNGDGDTNDEGETPAACHGRNDIFIAKLNVLGEVQWAKRLGSTDYDEGLGLAVNTGGDVFVTGDIGGDGLEYVDADLNGDGDTDDSEETVTAEDCYRVADIFIVKFDAGGNFQWAERLGGIYFDVAFDVAANNSGDIFVTGFICAEAGANGQADLNGDGDTNDSAETVSGCYGDSDVFVVKFNTNGGFQWAQRYGGSKSDGGYAVTTDDGNKIFVAGTVKGSADLNGDGDAADTNESGAGFDGSDIFISVIND